MRILVNTRFLLPGRLEGIGLYTLEVCTRLVEMYPEHEFVFAFDRPFDSAFVFTKNVIPVVVSPPARHPILFYLWFEHAIPRIYRRYNCDAFLSPDGFTTLSSGVTKNVVVIHDLAYLHFPDHIGWWMRNYYRKFVPRFMHAATHVVTVSNSTSEDLLSQFSLHKSKVSWAYNGVRSIFVPMSAVDQTRIRQGSTSGSPYFIALGAIQPRKNLSRILQAFDRFKQNDHDGVKLLVVGRRAWKSSAIDKVLKKMTYPESVIETGYIPDEELAALLGAAEGLIYPSLFEGFGLPIVEAMACGTPVVTSNVSSMKEIAGDSAILVNPYSVESIAQSMSALINDDPLRRRLSKTGILHANTFSWNTAAELLGAILFD